MYGLTSFVIIIDTFIILVLTLSQVTGIVLRNESLVHKNLDRMQSVYIVQNSTEFPANTSLGVKNIGDGKSIGGKWWMTSSGVLDLLQRLKSGMLERIKSRIGDVVKSRGDTGWHGGGGGHGLHSLEGALLTLAILTFAVFLINFIQQFVALLRTGIRTPLLGGRKRRDVEPVLSSNKDMDRRHEFSILTSNVLASIENPFFSNNILSSQGT